MHIFNGEFEISFKMNIVERNSTYAIKSYKLPEGKATLHMLYDFVNLEQNSVLSFRIRKYMNVPYTYLQIC